WFIVEVLGTGSVVTPDPEGLDPYLSTPPSPSVSPTHRKYEEPTNYRGQIADREEIVSPACCAKSASCHGL
ncbi:hypothetical protein, partial [Tessaracoccus caeni]|uniref:hypothetical protein n=1 Tax=Tessaracoccus caeni TaxID=3031239 RepID=UPI0023DC0214